jgi:hypothetical protein
MTQYKAIFKDRYEYNFRVSPTNPEYFEYLNYKGEWTEIGAIQEYVDHPQWILVAIN